MQTLPLAARFRRTRRIAALLDVLLLCLIPHLLWRLLRLRSPWPRIFLRLATFAVGARTRIIGTPLRKDVFFVANHLSWIDILAMGGVTGTAFVSKDDVGDMPLVGWLARQNNTLFISRTRRQDVREQAETLRAALAGHQPVTLFPEGTTGFGHELLPFKPALLSVMLPPPRDLRVQPVYIDYGPAAADIAWHEPSLADNALRLLTRPGTLTVTLHFLAHFDPRDFADRKALAAESRKRIAACLPPIATPPGTV
ncbi:lysophospholipid acyltransferase family protein [Sphingobium algorifonticola]|uniref:lysophospholipid acyltransferase family protein n=1 Tax=Sphingobium algorifonticola TaxID=2008318 RepID=UPI001F494388|nr:lysophospholipid acyltransferase family protein [Sphingobium algorifonticola]